MTTTTIDDFQITRFGKLLVGNDQLIIGEDGTLKQEPPRFGGVRPIPAAVEAQDSSVVLSNGDIIGLKRGVVLEDKSLLFVTKTGHVEGQANGVALLGGNATVVNAGTIVAQHDLFADVGPSAAIRIFDAFSSKIVNTGTIQAGKGVTDAIKSILDSDDTVINKGLIKGNVSLSFGDDVIDTSKGQVKGVIDTGAGSDTITGSAFADKITGGADADTFIFKTKPDQGAVDHITDFKHGQDKIALSKSMFKLDPGESVTKAFHDITGGMKLEQADDHILYNHKTGFLFYDVDGKGGAAPVHFATLDSHPILTAGDILMV